MSISRISLAIAAHALATNSFDTMFNVASLHTPEVVFKVSRLDSKLEGVSYVIWWWWWWWW